MSQGPLSTGHGIVHIQLTVWDTDGRKQFRCLIRKFYTLFVFVLVLVDKHRCVCHMDPTSGETAILL